jgi:hypothetical protein
MTQTPMRRGPFCPRYRAMLCCICHLLDTRQCTSFYDKASGAAVQAKRVTAAEAAGQLPPSDALLQLSCRAAGVPFLQLGKAEMHVALLQCDAASEYMRGKLAKLGQARQEALGQVRPIQRLLRGHQDARMQVQCVCGHILVLFQQGKV